MKFVILWAVFMATVATTSPLHAETPKAFVDTYTPFMEALRARCTGFENGEFFAPEDAVSYTTDFNGDGITDPIVDEARFACSSSATMFSGGTGGGFIHVFVSQPDGSYQRFEFLAHGAKAIVPQGYPKRPILLLSVHSGQCDVTAEPCYVAYVWSKTGKFVSSSGAISASKLPTN